jgi:hypothetical protein
MTAMLHCLVGDVAAAVRASLPGGRIAANDEGDAALTGRLTTSGLLDQADLMALLLQRADEERIATAARARSGRREARAVQALVSHSDGPVASAAMAFILGRGRRRDRFGQCLIDFDDLGPAAADALVHAIAAALRIDLAASRGQLHADLELAEACRKVIERRDPTRGMDALTSSLVLSLEQAGALGDDLVLAVANEGEILFVAEVLARRGGISTDAAIGELLSGEPKRIMALLRVGRASHGLAAGLLAAIGDLLGIADAGGAIALFGAMSDADVEAACAWLLTPLAYREALERLGQSRG